MTRRTPEFSPLEGRELEAYLGEVRGLVLDEIDRIIPSGTRYEEQLYRPMRAYPFRHAKGMRPALAVAVSRALGGRIEAILPSAAVLELYHNAFLVHDDVEDGSWSRRGLPTLHTEIGTPAAINVGDAMLALCLRPLLDNTKLVGLGPALHVLASIADMARETAEGQALELSWIRHADYDLRDADYIRMVHQKTTWYTFLTPIRIGCVLGGASPELECKLRRWGTLIGAAFQIQDDVLNLEAEEQEYGKEIDGDLWEGKHTLILVHALRLASVTERAHALKVLAKPRPPTPAEATEATKSLDEIQAIRALIERTKSIDYARAAARRRVEAAAATLERTLAELGASVHRDFLAGLTTYVLGRSR